MKKPRHSLVYFDDKFWGALFRNNGNRRTQKGDKRPAAEIDKTRVAKRREALRRRRKTWARRVEIESLKRDPKRTSRWYRPPGRRKNVETLLLVMQPGAWYGLSDLAVVTGLPSGSVTATVHQKMLAPFGYVQKVRNPAAPDSCWDGGPLFLWRLTAAGEAARAALLGAAQEALEGPSRHVRGDSEPQSSNADRDAAGSKIS